MNAKQLVELICPVTTNSGDLVPPDESVQVLVVVNGKYKAIKEVTTRGETNKVYLILD